MASIRDVMTSNPCTCDTSTTLCEAARLMARHNIGDVLVMSGKSLAGIVTDRDMVVRAIAKGMDPNTCTVGDICTGELATCSADASVEEAARLMRSKDIRRLPIMDGGKPVGVVSLGDLAMEQDPKSALADISAAGPNN